MLDQPTYKLLHEPVKGSLIMSSEEPIDDLEPPSPEAVEDALELAESLQEEINDYREQAQIIDNRFEAENEHRNLSLDDMPYGEELIRTRELPAELEHAIGLLSKIDEGKLLPEESALAFKEAESIIENAQSTIDDCTELSSDEEDDEFV